MKIKRMKMPIIILSIGILAAIISCLLTGIAKEPTVKEHDFSFSVTYKLNGEEKTIDNIYTCMYHDYDDGALTIDRYYYGEYKDYGLTMHTRSYTIDQKNGYDLCIVTSFNDAYLMNDTKSEYYDSEIEEPYIIIYDKDEICYEIDDLPGVFDAEIISWDYPEPIENSFKFVGIAELHEISMFCMLLISILALIACMIFVKKDEAVVYGVFDILGIVLNFLAAFVAFPIIFILSWLIQAFSAGPNWIYQIYFCLPAITIFSLAASISSRRKGLRLLGFFIQFLGPVILVALASIEQIV